LATAGAESRRTGSCTISAGADLFELIHKQEAVIEGGDHDRRLEYRLVQHGDRHLNVDRVPISGMNCLGKVSRDSGHTRVPAPPHMVTGKIFTADPAAPAVSRAH
jgi:hypothetical protein